MFNEELERLMKSPTTEEVNEAVEELDYKLSYNYNRYSYKKHNNKRSR